MEREEKSISNLIRVLGAVVEDQINNAIIKNTNTTRLEELDSLLKFKIKSLSYNDTVKHFNFPLNFIYEGHNCGESIVSSILENALMVQESNLELKKLIRYARNKISIFCQLQKGAPSCPQLTIDLKSGSNTDETDDSTAHLLSIINVILRTCRLKYNDKRTLEEFVVSTDLEQFLISRLKSGNGKFFIQSEILPFFITQSRSNQFIDNVFDFIFENRELTLLCSILKPWILEADQINLNHLFKSNKFWILLESCISGRNSFEQKQACFILKISVNFIINNADYKSHYYKYLHDGHEYEYVEEIEAALGSFFLLIDISNEKQLHLVQPCLGLLEKVNNLNLIWKLCIYKILLNHVQDSIVQNVAIKIISSSLDDKMFCDKIVGYLLRAINKNDYSDLSLNVYKHLNSFCLKCDEKQLSLLIKEATEINWNPTSMWLFCRNVIDPSNISKLNLELFLKFFLTVEKLPHIFIRKGCLSYITNVYFNNHSNIELKDVIIFLKNTKNFKSSYFSAMIQKSDQDKLLNYENYLLSIVKDSFETKLVDGDYFKIICKLVKMIQSIKIVDVIKINHKNFSKELQSIIYFDMFEHFDFKTVLDFAAETLTTLKSNGNIDEVTKLLDKVIAHAHGNSEILFLKSLDIIINDDTYCYDSYKKRLAFFIIKHDPDRFDQAINILQPILLITKDKIDIKICEYFLEMSFHRYREQNDRDLNEALKILNNILTIHPGAILIVVGHLKTLFSIHENELELDSLLEFTKICINKELPGLNKKVFLECVNIITQNLCLPKIFNNDKICEIILELYCLIKSNDESLIIIKSINELAATRFQEITTFIPLVVDLLLGGIIVNKNERCEYSVCQDIYNQKIDQLEISRSCPNYQRAEIRRYALETVLEASKSDEQFVIQLIDCLLSRYKKNYGKRYFPESEVHFTQLRIIQTLLLIHEYIPETCRREIIDFILNSFCDEIHQPCIKQLMQWLLILILKDTKLISDKINIANRSQPSTITAFIPVLYHITLKSGNESVWNETVQTLLPWTMGAHFKLRVYSQEGIIRLYKMAEKRRYETFLQLNRGLYDAVKGVVDSSGESFKSTIKQDIGFFEYFDPVRDFSKRTIFIDIPRYNNVSPNEWECFLSYKNIDAENRIFSDHVNDTLKRAKESTNLSDEKALLEVVQRKITPWKNAFDIDNNNYSKEKICDIILVTSLIEKSSNVGGLSRTCEIFGVSTFVLNSTAVLKDKEFKSLSMSSENWVNFVEVKKQDLIDFLKRGKSEGYVAVGAEQTNDSTSLDRYKFPKKCIIVLGNEKEGIPPDIISVLDKCIEIPQFGVTRSLNVHVAGSLLIWEYVKQHLT